MRTRLAVAALLMLVAVTAGAIVVTPGTIYVDATTGQMSMMAYYTFADTAARNDYFADPPSSAPQFCFLSDDTLFQVYTGKSGGDEGWFTLD